MSLLSRIRSRLKKKNPSKMGTSSVYKAISNPSKNVASVYSAVGQKKAIAAPKPQQPQAFIGPKLPAGQRTYNQISNRPQIQAPQPQQPSRQILSRTQQQYNNPIGPEPAVFLGPQQPEQREVPEVLRSDAGSQFQTRLPAGYFPQPQRGGGGSGPSTTLPSNTPVQKGPVEVGGSMFEGGLEVGDTTPGERAEAEEALVQRPFEVGVNNYEDPVLKSLMEEYAADAQLSNDPRKVRRGMLDEFQGQISAVNAIYDDLLGRAKQRAQERIGTERAQQARGGLLGSDFGTSQMSAAVGEGERGIQSVEGQRAEALATITNMSNQLAQQEIQRLDNLRASGAEGYLAALEQERSVLDRGIEDVVGSMIQQGVSPDELGTQLNTIAQTWKTTPNRIRSLYQAAQTESASMEPFTLSSGQSRYAYNPQTGQYEIIGGGAVSGGGFGISAEAQAYAEAIKSGQATLANVPEELRGQVAQALQATGDQVTPQQQRALNQAKVARDSLNDIFDNPALDRGALNRGVARLIPGSNTKDLRESVKTVQALIGFDELQDMRDASPTGGALGQVSEREIDFLQSLGGSINLSQSDEQLVKNLSRIQEAFDTLYLVNAPDGTSDSIGGVMFQKVGDKLITQAPDGTLYERRPDGLLEETSFNQASSIGSVDEALEKIGAVESSGNYQALGPVINKGKYKGQRAIGKYQIMEGNIPEWSKLALGYSVTPQEFYNNPQIQDAVARDQFIRNYEEYGNWNDVASVWFTGLPLAKAEARKRKDQLGTSVSEYVNRFNMA